MIALMPLLAAATLASGSPDPSRARLDSLADATAERIARYADRRAAIAAGYRRIGTDFPGMGEHWLHVGSLLAQRLDPDRPTMLAYATIDGRPTLLGAGYVVTTQGDTAATVPGWPTYWHEHSGLLADESGVRGVTAGVATNAPAIARAATATHVWVLHIWTALPNPSGRYEADNWSLPFARAGLAAPREVDADIGRAFSLAIAGGDEYLRRVLADAGLRGPSHAVAVDAAIATARAAAAGVAERARPSGAVSTDDAAELRAAWETLARRLREAVGPAVEPVLAPPHAHHATPARGDDPAASSPPAAPRAVLRGRRE